MNQLLLARLINLLAFERRGTTTLELFDTAEQIMQLGIGIEELFLVQCVLAHVEKVLITQIRVALVVGSAQIKLFFSEIIHLSKHALLVDFNHDFLLLLRELLNFLDFTDFFRRNLSEILVLGDWRSGHQGGKRHTREQLLSEGLSLLVTHAVSPGVLGLTLISI